MTLEQTKCPCCGAPMSSEGDVRVSTIENRIYYDGQDLKLVGRLASLAFILARRMPATVDRSDIIAQMWGDQEPEYADSSLKVACLQLRKALKPLGLAIETTWGIGLRMVKVSKTERLQPVENYHATA